MNVAEKVAKFKKDLKKDNQKSFNVWAFIFGSFYFLYKSISVWYFFLFYVFPWIFTAAMVPLYPNVFLWAIVGLAISHTWAGFVANPEERKYKENFVKNFKNVKLDAEVKYFNISPLRLWLSSFFTLGLYDIYWSYRNWSAYKKTTKDDVEPLLMAIFNCLTVYSLQDKVQRLLPERKRLNDICAILYTLLFFSAVVAYVLSFGLISLLLMITYALLPALLIPIQKSINSLAGKTTKDYQKGEILLLVVGVYCFLSSLLTPIPLADRLSGFSEVQQQQIGETIGFLYRHEQGYAKICAAEGYEMKKYPKDFAQMFGKEITEFERALHAKGITLEEIENTAIPESLKTRILLSVYEELKALRRVVILNVAADMQKISPENIVWKNEWEDAISLAEICNIFDIGGIEMLQNSSIKNFFSDKKF